MSCRRSCGPSTAWGPCRTPRAKRSLKSWRARARAWSPIQVGLDPSGPHLLAGPRRLPETHRSRTVPAGIGSEEVQPFSLSLEAEMMLEQLKEQHLQEIEDLRNQLKSKASPGDPLLSWSASKYLSFWYCS